MTDHSDLGNRMKRYENVSRIYITPRMPTIVRVDGKSFHSYTRGCDKPWDLRIIEAMSSAARDLLDSIQGSKIAYCQSDEISVLINDYEKFDTSPWFDKNVQKMSSVSASTATVAFNYAMLAQGERPNKKAIFDARSFTIPREDVVNYFYWRQIDAIRNSISGLAQKHFSHKELHKKNTKRMKEMLLRHKNIDWNQCATFQKRGWCVVRKTIKFSDDTFRTELDQDWDIPIFSQDREYIGKFLIQKEE